LIPRLLTIKLRYKQPDGETSRLLEFPLTAEDTRLEYATDDFKFASAVAAFGMLLRGSEHSGEATFEGIQNMAYSSKGEDRHGYRQEFVELIGRAMELTPAKE
jgi:Ca-activated chloride channel family protein